MSEKPILFSGPMVRAILDGRKTQTRRVVKERDYPIAFADFTDAFIADPLNHQHSSPYGQPGDRLWVRETFGVGTRPDQNEGWRDGIEYRADAHGLDEREDLPLHRVTPPDGVNLEDLAGKWRPSIHMPRWASRLTLEITDVRVERLVDISEDDARAEGISVLPLQDANDPSAWWQSAPGQHQARTPRLAFSALWDSINEARGYGWDANPWVWAISFRSGESR